jgi:tetratricopeptide (TPR) repeat protein
VYSNREALRFYARALSLLPKDSPNRFYAHEAREQILRGLGRPLEQMMELEAMRAFAEKAGEPSMIALAYNRLARHELDKARTAGVQAFLDRALSAATKAGVRGAEVEALKLTASLAVEEGDSERALALVDRALVRCGIDSDLLAARGSVMVLRATLLRRVGRLGEALEANAEAVVIFRRLGIKRNEAMALNALGVALYSMGEYEDAMIVLRASIALDREIGDRMHLGRKLSNVGQLYAELGDSETALAFLEHAERVFETVSDEAYRADALCAMAEVLLEMGTAPDEAAERLDHARRIADRTRDLYDQAHERIVRASLESAAGRLEEAVRAAQDGIDITRAAGLRVFEVLAQARLTVSLARLGRQEEARAVLGQLESRVEDATVERAERVHLAVAQAHHLLGDEEAARAAYARAQRVVEERVSRIRDDRLRAKYERMPIVEAIRRAPL